MPTTSSQPTTEVLRLPSTDTPANLRQHGQLWCSIFTGCDPAAFVLHFAVFLKHSQFADLNSASMKLWGKYPHLAVFPGALILDDGRPGDRDYPSSNLTQDQLSAEEPALSDEACQAGARQCLQEGYAYPGAAVAYFMQEAQKHGAKLLSNHSVQSLAPADCGKIVKGVVSDGEFHEADVVVLAAALGIPELVKPLGVSVPLTAKPRTVTVITKPMKRLLQHIVVTGHPSSKSVGSRACQSGM
ncbi:hypothetical protein ABBQ38_002475 [Trebouxia sp. C0009 RCD-2024]